MPHERLDPRPWYLKTLGTPALTGPEPRPPALGTKRLTVLAYLATRPKHRASRAYVTGLLWPGVEHQRARKSMNEALSKIRAVAPGLITSDEGTLVLDPSDIDVDLWQLRRCVAAGDHLGVIALGHAPFLEPLSRTKHVELGHWIDAENDSILSARTTAYKALIQSAESRGNVRLGLDYAKAWVGLSELSCEANTTMVEQLVACGNRDEALGWWDRYAVQAARATGERPEPPTCVLQPMAGVATTAAVVGRTRVPARGTRRVALGAIAAAVTVILTGTALAVLSGPRDRVTPLNAIRITVENPDPDASVLTPRLHFELSTPPETIVPNIDAVSEWELSAPSGDHVAQIYWSGRGARLRVLSAITGTADTILEPDRDHGIKQWSPDGRILLFESYSEMDDGSIHDILYRYDVSDGSVHPFVDRPDIERINNVSWSPLGSYVLVEAVRNDTSALYVVGADGHGMRRLAPEYPVTHSPSWSRDGRRLAFIGTKSDAPHLVIGEGLWGPRSMYVTAAPLGTAWFDADHVTYVRDNRLMRRSVKTGNETPVTSDTLRVLGITSARPTGPALTIDSLRFSPADGNIALGQAPVITPTMFQANTAMPREDAAGVDFEWRIADTTIVDLKDGRLHGRSPGATTAIATVGGWASDTLDVRVGPLRRDHEATPTFTWRWEDGIDPVAWVPFGHPAPTVLTGAGPDGGAAFKNNGDVHYHNGAISVRTFHTRSGLTLVVLAKAVVMGKPWTDLSLGFSHGYAIVDSAQAVHVPYALALEVSGKTRPDGTPEIFVSLGVTGPAVQIHYDGSLDQWREYAIQLYPNGSVQVLIDGVLVQAFAPRPETANLEAVHILLGYRSNGTDVLHGPVQVFEDLLYIPNPHP